VVWNMILTALAGLSQVINGVLSRRIAGRTLNRRERIGYESAFWALGIIGVMAVGMVGYRSARQERAHFGFEIKNVYRSAMQNGGIQPFSWYAVGKPLGFNIFRTNVGSGSAFNVNIFSRTYIEPDISEESQRHAISQFTEWIKSSSEKHKGGSIAKGEQSFDTAWGDILTPEDYSNLVNDRRIAFILSRTYFEDDFGSHVAELCKYIEPQPKPTADVNIPYIVVEIYAGCTEYNGEK
jgi:hypothetical protein